MLQILIESSGGKVDRNGIPYRLVSATIDIRDSDSRLIATPVLILVRVTHDVSGRFRIDVEQVARLEHEASRRGAVPCLAFYNTYRAPVRSLKPDAVYIGEAAYLRAVAGMPKNAGNGGSYYLIRPDILECAPRVLDGSKPLPGFEPSRARPQKLLRAKQQRNNTPE